MTKFSLNKVESFIKDLDDKPELKKEFKDNPQDTLIRKTALSPTNDVWVYRLVVCALSLVLLAITIGVLINIEAVQKASQVTTIIASLASAAIGALAGLLAPSPGAQEGN